MTSPSTLPSVGLYRLNPIVDTIRRDNIPSPASPIHLPAEVLTAICVALQHIRAYRTLATLMRVSFDLYIIAGPKLYQRLKLNKKGIQALLGPLGMLKGDLPGKTGIEAAWQELAFYPIGQDIGHQAIPPLWHVDWEAAESYSLNRPATLARDSVRRRLALLARTQDIAWHYTTLQLRYPHDNASMLPIFRSVVHLSLNYASICDPQGYRSKAIAACGDKQFPGSLMRFVPDICIEDWRIYASELELIMNTGSPRVLGCEIMMTESILAIIPGLPAALSFRNVDPEQSLVVAFGEINHYHLQDRTLDEISEKGKRDTLVSATVDFIFRVISQSTRLVRPRCMEFINVGAIIVRPGNPFEEYFHEAIQREVIECVRERGQARKDWVDLEKVIKFTSRGQGGCVVCGDWREHPHVW